MIDIKLITIDKAQILGKAIFPCRSQHSKYLILASQFFVQHDLMKHLLLLQGFLIKHVIIICLIGNHLVKVNMIYHNIQT